MPAISSLTGSTCLVSQHKHLRGSALTSPGIVSLLFCGICLKHYAYFNMSRRTQLTTKYIFQITAQLSENFIFIYLGLTLFTETDLEFKPLFIMITTVGICLSRWLCVFPLAKAINAVIRYRAKRLGKEAVDELPYNYQVMIFWAGLRGAVGVALAAGLEGTNGPALRATVLVVVVLTVIIFGGTTARMLEILGIRTGVMDEIDSDDEFDIEPANGGTYYKRGSTGLGHTPKPSIHLDHVDSQTNGSARQTRNQGYSSSNRHSPPIEQGPRLKERKNSNYSAREREVSEQQGNLLSQETDIFASDDDDAADLDLPPLAPRRNPSPLPGASTSSQNPLARNDDEDSGDMGQQQARLGPVGSIRNILRGAASASDSVAWLQQFDEDYIKPTLLLDQGREHREP